MRHSANTGPLAAYRNDRLAEAIRAGAGVAAPRSGTSGRVLMVMVDGLVWVVRAARLRRLRLSRVASVGSSTGTKRRRCVGGFAVRRDLASSVERGSDPTRGSIGSVPPSAGLEDGASSHEQPMGG